jgi:hypothetical protein
MWQRVWASENRATLRGGAVIGFFLTTALIFVTGFGGWLALVAGYVKPDTNPDLYFFQVGPGFRAGVGVGVEVGSRGLRRCLPMCGDCERG